MANQEAQNVKYKKGNKPGSENSRIGGRKQIPNPNRKNRTVAATGKQNQNHFSLKIGTQQGVLKLYKVMCDVSMLVPLWAERYISIFQATVLIEWPGWTQKWTGHSFASCLLKDGQ